MTGPHRAGQDIDIDCDVLIVGSGAGGATVADRLTAAGLDVVMLEEGPYLGPERAPQSIPDGVTRTWRGGGLTAGLGAPPISYVEGRCVGGGTEINSAIMQRAPDSLLQDWTDRYRIADFGPDALSPYYDQAAASVNATLTNEPLGAPSDALRRGAEALGWAAKPLERAQRGCVGTNLCSIGCPTGGKQSMTTTAIPQSIGRGMRLIADCRVDRLRLRRGRVTEVHGSAEGHDGTRHKVVIRPRDVFLCAGAVHTPALLRRSGIRRNIGNTLRLHPTVKVIARFDQRMDAATSRIPLYAVTEFMPELRLGGSFFQPGFFGMGLAEDWHNRGWLLPEWDRCGMYYAMARASGTGRIRPLPNCREPLVQYKLSQIDWKNLADGLGHLGRAMFAAGATHVYPSIAGHPGWTDTGQCDEFGESGLPKGRTNLMTIHLFSSCPPGEDASLCATDSFGRVHSVENLIVADASQIPEAPGVNPQLTIMAMARRSADAYLEAAA